MKIRFMLVILLGIIVLLQSYVHASTQTEPIEQLIQLAEQEQIPLEKWQVVMKDELDRNRASKIAKNLANYFPASYINREETSQAVKWVASNLHKQTQLSETFIMIVPKKEHGKVQISYALAGENWSEQTRSIYLAKTMDVTKVLFTPDVKKFACLSMLSNDKMNKVYFFEKFVEKLNVQALDSIQEKDFTVLSGYTPYWEQTIPGKDSLMNIQLAAREDAGGNTTMTIGTPIIITEY
ncbi:YwmB family TATA-box binding protein [Virgibacillus senegalensis]|uniref:YwmB family TATA-box binding protein n=1 Tax=Virgibacillus senegalensis TaxID=1499679 RepID=UPI00069FF3B6|nr:YwmB family TATA-box binding protein [Virgibacillus senegalensis]